MGMAHYISTRTFRNHCEDSSGRPVPQGPGALIFDGSSVAESVHALASCLLVSPPGTGKIGARELCIG